VWLIDVARALRKGLGEKARWAPKFELPNFMVKIVGLFDAPARAIVPELGLDRKMDNSRVKKALGIEFIPVEEAAIASGRSLIEYGLA
jgi:dihydroflavonol-4-reductase